MQSLPPETTSKEDAVQKRWGQDDFQKVLESAFWMNHPVVQGHLNRLATGVPIVDWLTWFIWECIPTDRPQRVLVLGCGEGWLERSIASLRWIDRIDAFDVAAGAVQRARTRASVEGLKNIHYDVMDLNRETAQENTYDVVIAHSVLHHVENLEFAFAGLHACLRPGGRIAINEFVGRRYLQYTDEAMDTINQIMAVLEPRYRVSVTSGQTLEAKWRPDLSTVLAEDPSEGVRADELDAFIRRHFTIDYEAALGGTILQHLLWEIIGNFRLDDPIDRCILEWICLLEEASIAGGSMPSDYRFYVCSLAQAPSPIAFARKAPNWTPNRSPEATVAIDPDLTDLGRDLVPEGAAGWKGTQPPEDPIIDRRWRDTATAQAHFHTVATEDPNGDWLTKVLGDLDRWGLGPKSRVLLATATEWMIDPLRSTFETLDLMTSQEEPPSGRYDLIFAVGSEGEQVLNQTDGWVARQRSLLAADGVLVVIDSGYAGASNRGLVERFSAPLSDLLETLTDRVPGKRPSLSPPPESGPSRPRVDPSLFEFQVVAPLGGELTGPLLDASWAWLREEQRSLALVAMLGTVERLLLADGVITPDRVGVLLSSRPLTAS